MQKNGQQSCNEAYNLTIVKDNGVGDREIREKNVKKRWSASHFFSKKYELTSKLRPRVFESFLCKQAGSWNTSNALLQSQAGRDVKREGKDGTKKLLSQSK